MPTYDYKCGNCDHEFEEILLISKREEPTKVPCQECGGEVKQIIAAPYFGYDNIKTRYSTNNKEPGWYSDKIKDMKRNIPGNTL